MSDTPKPSRGAGFRASNARRIEPALLPWPAAEWGLWAFMPKATLRAAVLLSVGLEPQPMRAVRTGDARPMFAEPGPEFQRRLTLACAHLSEHGPLRPLNLMQLLGAPGDVEVSLSGFRAWADGMGWAMPEAFPGANAPAPAPAALKFPADVPKADRGECVKRAALIERNRRRWLSIERDLKDASSNGLSTAAKADTAGFWWEGDALKWAEARNKVEAPAAPVNLASVVHRMAG